jgi:hypothetical protein
MSDCSHPHPIGWGFLLGSLKPLALCGELLVRAHQFDDRSRGWRVLAASSTSTRVDSRPLAGPFPSAKPLPHGALPAASLSQLLGKLAGAAYIGYPPARDRRRHASDKGTGLLGRSGQRQTRTRVGSVKPRRGRPNRGGLTCGGRVHPNAGSPSACRLVPSRRDKFDHVRIGTIGSNRKES